MMYINTISRKLKSKFGEKNFKYITDFLNFGFWYFVAAFLAFYFNRIVNSTLTRYEYGVYSYYRQILDILAVTLPLQLYCSYLRFNIKGVSPILQKIVYKVSIISMLVLAVVAVILTGNVWSIPFAALIAYNERIYMARSVMDIKSINILKIVSALLTLVIVIMLKYYGIFIKGEYIICSLGIGYMVSLPFYSKKYDTYDDSESVNLKLILKFSLPTLAIVIVGWLLSFSAQIIIKQYYGFEILSSYTIAQRVIIFSKMFSGLMLLFYPTIYYREIEVKNFRTINITRMVMSVIMLFVGCIAFIGAKYIYILFGASQYIEYVSYFRILIIAETIYTISSFYSTYLGYKLQTYKTLIICSIGAIINLILLFCFLKSYGIVVAAYSILISNSVMAVMFFIYAGVKEKAYFNKLKKSCDL